MRTNSELVYGHNCVLLHCYTERCREGDFQIDGGPTDLVGNVEVCVNRTWGTVCAEGWDDIAASILCQQIGHSPNGIFLT